MLWRRKLQSAYAHGGYADATRAVHRPGKELAVHNEYAARSLEEGSEETLTLHRLTLPDALRRSLSTTNQIESVIAQIERETQRGNHWRTSDQKQRWCAATLLHIQQNFRLIRSSPCVLAAGRVEAAVYLDHHRGISRLTPTPSEVQLNAGLTQAWTTLLDQSTMR